MPGHVCAFEAFDAQVEGELVLLAPAVSREQPDAALKVSQRRVESCEVTRAATGGEIELGNLLAFDGAFDQVGSGIEIVDHGERHVAVLLRSEAGQQAAADAQAYFLALMLGDQGIGRLLHAIVQELEVPRRRFRARVVSRDDEALGCGGLYGFAQRFVAHLHHHGEIGEIEPAAQAGCGPEHFLGLQRKREEFPGHQVEDVLSDALGGDLPEIPLPARLAVVEGEQLLVMQEVQELVNEERIAVGLAPQQLGQVGHPVGATVQGVVDQHADIGRVETAELEPSHSAPGADLLDHAGNFAHTGTFIAASADHEQMRSARIPQQCRQQSYGGRVRPLQVVEEQRKCALLAGKHAQQTPEHVVEPVAFLCRGKLLGGAAGLRRRSQPEQQTELGNDAGNHVRIRTDGRGKLLAPSLDRRLAAGEQLVEQHAKGLDDEGVGLVLSELVELRGDKRAVAAGFVFDAACQPRLADAGGAGDDDQLDAPAGCPLEGGA